MLSALVQFNYNLQFFTFFFFNYILKTALVFVLKGWILNCVFAQFRHEEDAEKAVMDLNNRWFNGQPIHAELSPVTDFREACCRQYEMGSVLEAQKSTTLLVQKYIENKITSCIIIILFYFFKLHVL